MCIQSNQVYFIDLADCNVVLLKIADGVDVNELRYLS